MKAEFAWSWWGERSEEQWPPSWQLKVARPRREEEVRWSASCLAQTGKLLDWQTGKVVDWQTTRWNTDYCNLGWVWVVTEESQHSLSQRYNFKFKICKGQQTTIFLEENWKRHHIQLTNIKRNRTQGRCMEQKWKTSYFTSANIKVPTAGQNNADNILDRHLCHDELPPFLIVTLLALSGSHSFLLFLF